MKRYIRATTENHNVFEMSTHTSYYDNFLNEKDLEYMRKAKNRDGNIVMMTPDEYFEYASEIFQHRSSPSDLVEQRSDKDTEQYIKDMKNGDKFPLPYLNFADPGQEGLHRMLAAKRAFGSDIKYPVLVVTVYDQDVEDAADFREEVRTFKRKCFEDILEYLEHYIARNYHVPPENLTEIATKYIQDELESYNEFNDTDYNAEFKCVINEYPTEIRLCVYLTKLNGKELDSPELIQTSPWFDNMFDYEEDQEQTKSVDDYLNDLSDEELEELLKDAPELYGLFYNN